jgi:hypothetical protein
MRSRSRYRVVCREAAITHAFVDARLCSRPRRNAARSRTASSTRVVCSRRRAQIAHCIVDARRALTCSKRDEASPSPRPGRRRSVDGEGGPPRPLGREEGRWPGQGLGEASCFY